MMIMLCGFSALPAEHFSWFRNFMIPNCITNHPMSFYLFWIFRTVFKIVFIPVLLAFWSFEIGVSLGSNILSSAILSTHIIMAFAAMGTLSVFCAATRNKIVKMFYRFTFCAFLFHLTSPIKKPLEMWIQHISKGSRYFNTIRLLNPSVFQ